jgi:hypothetical protein
MPPSLIKKYMNLEIQEFEELLAYLKFKNLQSF